MASACGFRLKRTNKSSKNQKKPSQPHQMRVIPAPEKSSKKIFHSRRFERRRNSGEWEPNRAGENAYLGAESTRGFVAWSDASAPDLNFFGRTSGRTLRAARWATATGACERNGVYGGEWATGKGSRGGGRKGQDVFISSCPY